MHTHLLDRPASFAETLGAEPMPRGISAAGPYPSYEEDPAARALNGLRLRQHAEAGSICLQVQEPGWQGFTAAGFAGSDAVIMVCSCKFQGLPALVAVADFVVWRGPSEGIPQARLDPIVLAKYRAAIRAAIAAGPADPFWRNIWMAACAFSPEFQ